MAQVTSPDEALSGFMAGDLGYAVAVDIPNPVDQAERNVFYMAGIAVMALGIAFSFISIGDAVFITVIWLIGLLFVYWFKEVRNRPIAFKLLWGGFEVVFPNRREFVPWYRVTGLYSHPGGGTAFYNRRLRNGALRVANVTAPYQITYQVAEAIRAEYLRQNGVELPRWDGKLLS